MTKTGKRGMAQAAGLIMFAITISRILGFVRERAVAQVFGRTRATDIFYAAFSIPDLMYYLLIGGALSAAFIPVFTEYLARDREEEAWYVASTFINFTILFLVAATILGIIFTPQLAPLVAYSFRGQDIAMLIRQMRFMFPAVFFTALAGLQMGILNSYRQFGPPAFGPIVYNIAIILAAYLLSPRFGLTGMAIGVVTGAICNFLLQFPFVMQRNAGYRPLLDLKHPGIRKMIKLMIPSIIGLSIVQVNLIVNQSLASSLPAGSITALRYANRLMQLPLGIFAMGISTAVFPTLARQASRREMGAFQETFSLGLRTVFYITIPAGVGLLVLGVPIVRLLFEGAEFSPADTAATAYALGFYSFGLFPQSAIQVLTRVYYSLNDTVTPVITGLGTVLLNFTLNLVFLHFTNLSYGGLALAFSLASVFNFLTLLVFLRRKLGTIGGRALLTSFSQSTGAALVMGAVVYWLAELLARIVPITQPLGQLVQVGGAIAVGSGVYFLITYMLRMEEVLLVVQMLKAKLQRR